VGLRLTVLGSSAAWSERPGRPSSAYLVEHPEGAIILDLGQGSLSSVFGRRDPSSLSAVVISHEHSDHHVDLIPLRHLLRYGYEEPRRIGLHVPDELRRRYDVFNGEDGFLDDLVGPELVAGTRDIGPFVLESRPVMHSEMSFAFRVTEAIQDGVPGLVYSGDCGRADDLLPLIRPGDTVLCEAFWSTREPVPSANHLTAAEAARVAEQGGAGSLVLTHILDAHDPQAALAAAHEAFDGPVLLAEPDLRLDLDGQGPT
jgi:ribonuclease BN (tRNA processing enzyme)